MTKREIPIAGRSGASEGERSGSGSGSQQGGRKKGVWAFLAKPCRPSVARPIARRRPWPKGQAPDLNPPLLPFMLAFLEVEEVGAVPEKFPAMFRLLDVGHCG